MFIISFCWAITSHNKLRSTWTDAIVYSAETEAAGYPKEYANDGNNDSRWKATATNAEIIIDTGVTTPDLDYLFMRFDRADIPTSVDIKTSSTTTSGDFASIYNNLNKGSSGLDTTTSAALDGSSRIIPLHSNTYFYVGNTVLIDDHVSTAHRYLVVGVGSTFIEVERFPEAYLENAHVSVCANTSCLVVIDPSERKRYIKIDVTCAVAAHLYEVCGFSVDYVFDGTALPLNPYPVELGWELGAVGRTLSGYGIGRMTMAPPPRKIGFTIQRTLKDGLDVMEAVMRGERFGILMDDGDWNEGILSGVSGQRRQSSDSELVGYGLNCIFDCI